jgi:proteasome lid subunit RPN8/RPN11
MMGHLEMSQAHLEEMRAHVESCSPNEACGLLAGTGNIVKRVLPIANQERSPSRFRMDPREQLRGFRSIEEAGLELVAIFHSHPAETGSETGPVPGPSVTDIREAAYPVAQVIWFRRPGLWSARGFWIEDGYVTALPLQIVAGE